MVLHHWKKDEFFRYLESKGCTMIPTDYPDVQVFVGPSNSEVVPIKLERSYYHPIIIRTCEYLGIPAPDEFLVLREEFINLRKACERNPPLIKVGSFKKRMN